MQSTRVVRWSYLDCVHTHTHIPASLLLVRWYEIMAFYYYIPLSASKFASDFGNFNSKFSNFQNFGKKFPNFRIFFQNFQNHKGAAADIKGAATSLLANYKIFIFFHECPKLGVYNIKHNLARSCFQLWPSKSATRVTKFREKTVSASASPFFFSNFF